MEKRILIADDHPVLRMGFVVILKNENYICDEADNCRELMKQISTRDYHLIILDITFPDGNGLEILKQAKVFKPHTPILIYSIHSEEEYAIRALRAGAAGYLNKRNPVTELVVAVNRILAGKKYVSADMIDSLADELNRDHKKKPHELLSDRELEVLQLLAQGTRVAQVAEKLALSGKTVGTYRARGLEKMGMKSNAEFIRYAVAHHLD